MTRAELKGLAKEKLRGKWISAGLATLVTTLLGGYGNNGTPSNSSNVKLEDFTMIPPAVLEILYIFLGFAVLWALLGFVIGSTVRLGHNNYYIKLCRGEEVSFGLIFSRFNIFVKAFVLNILMTIFTILWSLLFIIPGIIKYYSYAMAPFILAEDTSLTASAAIDESKKIMRGHKMELFVLNLSFIGWSILCIFTFFIGLFWLLPYIQATTTEFYLSIKRSPNVIEDNLVIEN